MDPRTIPPDDQTSDDDDNFIEDAYEAGWEAAKQVPIEVVEEALDFASGYFDCLRKRVRGEGQERAAEGRDQFDER